MGNDIYTETVPYSVDPDNTLLKKIAASLSGSGAGGSGGGSAGIVLAQPTVTHHEAILTATSQVVPAGAKGWTATVLTGTGTFGSAAGLPAGFSDSDPNTLANSITITAAANSTVYVRWNT